MQHVSKQIERIASYNISLQVRVQTIQNQQCKDRMK